MRKFVSLSWLPQQGVMQCPHRLISLAALASAKSLINATPVLPSDAATLREIANFFKVEQLHDSTTDAEVQQALQKYLVVDNECEKAMVNATSSHDFTLLLMSSETQLGGRRRLALFSPVDNTVVFDGELDNPMELADALVHHGCRSHAAIIVVDGFDAPGDALAHDVTIALHEAGVRAHVWRADRLFQAYKGDSSAPSVSEKFCSAWSQIAIASHAFAQKKGSVLATLLHYLLPEATLSVAHVVTMGSQGLSVSLFDPVPSRTRTFRGTLSDVVRQLITLPSAIIILPTFRSDRATLFMLRQALQQCNKQATVIFPSDITEEFSRQGLHGKLKPTWNAIDSSPELYWQQFLSSGCFHDGAEAIIACRRAAGYILRKTQGEVLETSAKKVEQVRSAAAPGNSKIDDWLRICRGNNAREAQSARIYETLLLNPLFVGWCATNETTFGRPENPFSGNRILGLGLTDSHDHWTSPLFSVSSVPAMPDLDPYSVLVTVDAKQFLLFMRHDEALQRFLDKGGRVWCLTTAEYHLSAQTLQKADLGPNSVGSRYGFLKAGVFSSCCCEADSNRTASAVTNHCKALSELVRFVFSKQIARARSQAMIVTISNRMEFLTTIAEIERNGIFVDSGVARELAKDYNNEINEIKQSLFAFLPKNFPVDQGRQMDWNNPLHLRAFLFGGGIPIGGVPGNNVPSLGWMRNFFALAKAVGYLPEVAMHPLAVQFLGGNVSTPENNMKQITQLLEQNGLGNPKIRVVVFDIESTGLNPMTDEIVDVAFLDPVEQTSFSTLVNPRRHIPMETTRIHRITNDTVRNSPHIGDVSKRISKFLRLTRKRRPGEVVVLVSHNAFSLDEPLLRRTMETHQPESNISDVLFCDSLQLMKMIRTRHASSRTSNRIREALQGSLKLGKIAEQLRIESGGDLHRAKNDALLLWKILREIIDVTRESSESTARDALLAVVRNSVLSSYDNHCLSVGNRSSAVVAMPGRLNTERRRSLRNALKTRLSEASPCSPAILQKLSDSGVVEATLLLSKKKLEASPLRTLQFQDDDTTLLYQHPDGCIHSCFDLCATSTSRVTSCFPSSHTFPKANKSPLRRILVSRFGAKGYCVEIDFSQLEVCTIAALSRDTKLGSELNDGVDLHAKKAAWISRRSYQSVLDDIRNGCATTIALRQKAKEFTFQKLYGAGASLIHKSSGMPLAAVKELIRRDQMDYPGIGSFYELVRSVSLRPGNPGLPTHFFFELPTGLSVAFSPRDCVLNLPPLKNYPVQAFGTEIVATALVRLSKALNQLKKRAGNKVFITNFVHDSVWLDIHEDVVDEVICESNRVLSDVRHHMATTFPGFDIGIDFKCSVTKGRDMFHMESVPAVPKL